MHKWVKYLHGRILKQAVVRVEHLFRQEVEPFSRHSSIVQAHLTVKLNPQPWHTQRQSYYFLEHITSTYISWITYRYCSWPGLYIIQRCVLLLSCLSISELCNNVPEGSDPLSDSVPPSDQFLWERTEFDVTIWPVLNLLGIQHTLFSLDSGHWIAKDNMHCKWRTPGICSRLPETSCFLPILI